MGSLRFILSTQVPGTASATDRILASHACCPVDPTLPKSPTRTCGSQTSSSSCNHGLSWPSAGASSRAPQSSRPHKKPCLILLPTWGPREPPRPPILRVPLFSPRSPSQAGNLDPAKRSGVGVGEIRVNMNLKYRKNIFPSCRKGETPPLSFRTFL